MQILSDSGDPVVKSASDSIARSHTDWVHAQRPRTPPARLLDLLERGDDAVRFAVLRNPGLPVRTMHAIFEAATEKDRWPLLGNAGLHRDVLTKFALHYLHPGREHAAWIEKIFAHPNATREILQTGLFSSDPRWRVMAASNLSMPADMAATAMANGPAPVRSAVIGHASWDVFDAHDWDAERSVATLRAAFNRLVLMLRVRGPKEEVWTRMARVGEALFVVARSVDDRAIAANSSRNPVQLLALCADPEKTVRFRARDNPACPDEGKVMVALS